MKRVVNYLLLIIGILIVNNCIPRIYAQTVTCTTEPTTYGVVTETMTVPSSGAYTVWSRIMASSASQSYWLQIKDANNQCVGNYTVGSTSLSTSNWTWVNYQDGTITSLIRPTLNTGTYTFTMIGKDGDGFKLDKILLTTDTTCTPTGTGDNCTGVTITPGTGNCSCLANNTCNTNCAFKGTGNISSCMIGTATSNPFLSQPNDTDKIGWCTNAKRAQGDTNGDGVINDLDYYYYVRAVNGGQIPHNVNPDFNGDGDVGLSDRYILIPNLPK